MICSADIIKTRLKFWISKNRINEWFERRTVFFILGLGRSGTKFLADVLNRKQNAIVFHEPIRVDFEALVEAHKSGEAARKYIKTYRKKKMFGLVKNLKVDVYGEANSNLRYHRQALMESFPNAKLLHVVRDGRDVVRSIMARKHYTGSAASHHELKPRDDDPLLAHWDQMRRFEKICWLWADANRSIRCDVLPYVKFEYLVSDYDYFLKHIETYLDIEIGEVLWHEVVSKPTNITMRFNLPKWTEWDDRLMQTFNSICAEEMEYFGYY